MSPGDVSGSKDHDHERGTDRERGDDAGRAGDDGAADSKNEKECADKFRDIFVHSVWVGCGRGSTCINITAGGWCRDSKKLNGATGASDMAGEAARVAVERSGSCRD